MVSFVTREGQQIGLELRDNRLADVEIGIDLGTPSEGRLYIVKPNANTLH